MRADMHKVICEEARLRRGRKAARMRKARLRLSVRLDPDGLPRCEGMRRPYIVEWTRKEFGDHIMPLYRWICGQAGRPWNRISSELHAVLDMRKVVHHHVWEHVIWWVEVSPLRVTREMVIGVHGWPSRAHFYVDGNGLLRRAPKRRDGREAEKPATEPNVVRVDDRVEYHDLGGAWFQVEFEYRKDAKGVARRVPACKRQLSKRDVRRLVTPALPTRRAHRPLPHVVR